MQILLESLDILPLSEMVVVKFESPNSKYSFLNVYKVAKNFPIDISHLGTAEVSKRSTNLELDEKFLSKSTRKDLKGIQLQCALVVRQILLL